MKGIWRESASLILVAKTTFGPFRLHSDYNYKLLMLKRSSKSEFMPGTYVFPGGTIEKADGSKSWLNLYESFGFKYDTFEKLNPKENRPPIFNNDDANQIPKFLSLRISAIRETFEESGILICRSFKINYKERVARWASFIGGGEIKKWQDKVHDNPDEFYKLCKEFEVYPDVWALKEWSNWVTPPSFKQRFNTVFFLAAFHQTPAAHAEKKEVQHLEWDTPKDYLRKNNNEKIILPPPQFYELSRLTNFKDVDALHKFSSERSGHGLEQYLPHLVSTDDGMFSILPGDDLYPADLDRCDDEVAYIKALPPSYRKNRISLKPLFDNTIITSNFNPMYNHLVPLNFKSKL